MGSVLTVFKFGQKIAASLDVDARYLGIATEDTIYGGFGGRPVINGSFVVDMRVGACCWRDEGYLLRFTLLIILDEARSLRLLVFVVRMCLALALW